MNTEYKPRHAGAYNRSDYEHLTKRTKIDRKEFEAWLAAQITKKLDLLLIGLGVGLLLCAGVIVAIAMRLSV